MSRKLPLYIERSRYYRPSQPTIHDDSRGKDPAETTAKISSGRKEKGQEEERHREKREEDRGSVGKRASTWRWKLMPEVTPMRSEFSSPGWRYRAITFDAHLIS